MLLRLACVQIIGFVVDEIFTKVYCLLDLDLFLQFRATTSWVTTGVLVSDAHRSRLFDSWWHVWYAPVDLRSLRKCPIEDHRNLRRWSVLKRGRLLEGKQQFNLHAKSPRLSNLGWANFWIAVLVRVMEANFEFFWISFWIWRFLNMGELGTLCPSLSTWWAHPLSRFITEAISFRQSKCQMSPLEMGLGVLEKNHSQ